MTNAVSVRGVSKRFRVRHPQRPHTLHEALTRGFRRMGAMETFWALRDVTMDVPRGVSLGIVGSNGAGKSTLLRLIAHVGRPDAGSIEVRGRVAALLDLGAGFHPDLTGIENVMLAGVISGLTRQEVREQFDEIVRFAELESFIDNPLRTYSMGMRMRLAFSVAALVEPDILLVDEVLVVGDLSFQHKCVKRISELKARGCTLLLCSQNMSLMQEMCDTAVWLDRGRVVEAGPARPVLEGYVRASSSDG